jgi:N-acetylneuraminate synthase
MQQEFNLPVGYSDHTETSLSARLAVALGVTIIEKHFTFSRLAIGPDHRASFDQRQMKEYVNSIERVVRILGHSDKYPAKSEIQNRNLIRKGLYAKRKLEAGSILKPDDILLVRPAGNQNLKNYWNLVNNKIKRSYQLNEELE